MKKITFVTLIKKSFEISKSYHELYNLGVDVISFSEKHQEIISILMEEAFTEEGHGWLEWYLYEKFSDTRKPLDAWDEDKNSICHDVDSLWKHMQQYLRGNSQNKNDNI